MIRYELLQMADCDGFKGTLLLSTHADLNYAYRRLEKHLFDAVAFHANGTNCLVQYEIRETI